MNHPQYPPVTVIPPWWHEYKHHNDYHGNEVPARVKVAQDFLTMLSLKTMPRAAVTDFSIEVIDGQELLPVENAAQAAACNMLMEYFGGKLAPSEWEDWAQNQGNRVLVITCPHCKNDPVAVKSCEECGQRGQLITKV